MRAAWQRGRALSCAASSGPYAPRRSLSLSPFAELVRSAVCASESHLATRQRAVLAVVDANRDDRRRDGGRAPCAPRSRANRPLDAPRQPGSVTVRTRVDLCSCLRDISGSDARSCVYPAEPTYALARTSTPICRGRPYLAGALSLVFCAFTSWCCRLTLPVACCESHAMYM